MPDNSTDRIRRLLKTARKSVETTSSILDRIEEEIGVLKKERYKERIQRNQAAQAICQDKKAGQKTNAPDSKDKTTPTNKTPLLTVKEAAVILRLHKISVYRLISKGGLPSCRIGKAIRIPAKALTEHIQAAHAGEGGG